MVGFCRSFWLLLGCGELGPFPAEIKRHAPGFWLFSAYGLQLRFSFSFCGSRVAIAHSLTASPSESAGISRDRPALRDDIHRSRDLLSALALSLAPSDRTRRLVF